MPSSATSEGLAAFAEGTTEYVERWFVPFTTIVRRSGACSGEVRSLLDAGAAPGIIYSRSAGGVWWSALGSRTGIFEPVPPPDGSHWYAPAALYWLRHGKVTLRAGGTVEQAAAANRDRVVCQFLAALATEPLAEHAFPDAFVAGRVDAAAASDVATYEWQSWLRGGYAVCLRSFTGSTCVQKEALGQVLKRQRIDGADEIADEILLDLIERLNALMLPFAPFQRPTGTPGLAVDRLLDIMGLGLEEPYRHSR